MASKAVICPPHNPPRRKNYAVKHAEAAAIGAIYFVISISRWTIPQGLSERAKRVLRFFCALNRHGGIGYLGTRAALGAVADGVRRATEEKCSVKTLQRAIAELVRAGYLLKSDGYAETARELAPDEWIRNKVVVLTLTAKALELWSEVHCPTSAHGGTKCPSNDLPDASPCLGESTARDCAASSDRDEARVSSSAGSRADGARPRAGSAVAVAVTEPRQSPRPVAPLATLADGLEGGAQATCQPTAIPPRRPPRPHGAPPRPLELTVREILEALRAVVFGRGRLEDAVLERARLELLGLADGPLSGVEWSYWLAVWPILKRSERRFWARRELVPLLSRPSSSSSSPAASSRPSSSSSSPAPDEELDPSNPFAASYLRILERLRSEGRT